MSATRSINNTEDNIKIVEAIIKALGTMVIEPQYEADPNEIGKKLYAGNIQKPIVEGEKRNILLTKLIDTIEQL